MIRWRDLVPPADLIKSVQGVEADLLRRRRTGALGGTIAVVLAVIQILAAAQSQTYLQALQQALRHLAGLQWIELFRSATSSPQNLIALGGTLAVAGGLGVYFLYRWTGVLRRDAEEPFRYTFWIEPFAAVAGTPGPRFTVEALDQFALLHHDLRGRLSQRITRLSLRSDAAAAKGDAAKPAGPLPSHVNIGGDYTVRQTPEGWTIQIMPRVRIGPPDRPEALTSPVEFLLDAVPEKPGAEKATAEKPNGDKPGADKATAEKPAADKPASLAPDQYLQIIERLYSLVATELYRQIKLDLQEKIRLFPWPYLRAVALFHEAQDFERSNTIDAYEHAVDLYRQARRYFDTTNLEPVSRLLRRCPCLWRLERRFLQMEARTRIGLARCLIYRRILSPLMGRTRLSPFELPELAERAIDNACALYNRCVGRAGQIRDPHPPRDGELGEDASRSDRRRATIAFLTYPEDSLLRRERQAFERIRETAFDAYTVAALAHLELQAHGAAGWYLRGAQALDPSGAERHGLWLLARARLEPRLELRISQLRSITELVPRFEIARYHLARDEDGRLRMRELLTKERAAPVEDEYREVLRINPGNIAALAALGYLRWLVKDHEGARRAFRRGLAVRAVVSEAFVGELSYGLARSEFEDKAFNQSYELYQQAIAADVGVAAAWTSDSYRGTGGHLAFVGAQMLARFRELRTAMEALDTAPEDLADRNGKPVSPATRLTLGSFVLNDVGVACLQAWLRSGDRPALDEAIAAFQAASRRDPSNGIAVYNLSIAEAEAGEDRDAHLARAKELLPGWTVVQVEAAMAPLRQRRRQLAQEREEAYREARKVRDDIAALQAELEALDPRPDDPGQAAARPAGPDTDAARATRLGAADPGRAAELLWQGPAPVADPPRAVAVTAAAAWARQVRDEIAARLVRARESAERLTASREQRDRERAERERQLLEAADAARRTIVGSSRVSALFAEAGAGDPSQLLDEGVVWHRFDDADLRTLVALAELEVTAGDQAWRARSQRLRNLATVPPDVDPGAPVTLAAMPDVIREDLGVRAGASSGDLHALIACLEREIERDDAPAGAWARLAARLRARRAAADGTAMAGGADLAADSANLPSVGAVAKLAALRRTLGNRAWRGRRQGLVDFLTRIRDRYYPEHFEVNLALAETYEDIGVRDDGEDAPRDPGLEAARLRMCQALKRVIETDPSHYAVLTWLHNFWGLGRVTGAELDRQAVERYLDRALAGQPGAGATGLRAQLLHTEGQEQRARALRPTVAPDQRIEALRQAVGVLEREVALQRAVGMVADAALLNRARVELALATRCGAQVLDPQPETVALGIAMGRDVLQAFEVDGWVGDNAERVMAAWRDSMKRGLGIRVPRIRLWTQGTFAGGEYVLLIQDVPVGGGTLSPTDRFCAVSPAELKPLGVVAADATHPVTGELGSWVAKADWATVSAHHSLWSVADYPRRELEARLEAQLHQLVGHEEVAERLAELDEALRLPADALTDLVQVIRALLREGIMVTPFAEIVEEYSAAVTDGFSLARIVERLRGIPAVLAQLPGRDARHVPFRLTERAERALEEAIEDDGRHPALALRPGRQRQALRAVQNLLTAEPRAVLVVERDSLRPWLRALIRDRHPGVPVLARRELAGDPAAGAMKEIDLWPERVQ